MKTAEIYEALKARGIHVIGKIPTNNLSAHLSHHKQMFLSTSAGWVLWQAQFVDQPVKHNSSHGKLVALGKTNPEIGRILGVSPNSARNMVNHILLKAGVPNRTCLAVMWVKKRP